VARTCNPFVSPCLVRDNCDEMHTKCDVLLISPPPISAWYAVFSLLVMVVHVVPKRLPRLGFE